jgi:hypothetical protein
VERWQTTWHHIAEDGILRLKKGTVVASLMILSLEVPEETKESHEDEF